MTSARKITDNIYWVGAVDWHRQTFDELIPLSEGTSYNAYLVQGSERTALIDAVDPPFVPVLLDRLDQLGVKQLDYIVSNHSEQDHSGGIPMVLDRFPGAQVLCTPKAKGILRDLLPIAEPRIQTVEDGERVPLGGRSLMFFHMPWVHWPETMVTYLEEDQILFSCDLFGSHLATSALFSSQAATILPAMKRYYAEIMMPFRIPISKYLDRLGPIALKLIAPSHGPIHDKPEQVLDIYRSWTAAEPGNSVVVAYVSMHGSVQQMAERLIEALLARNVSVDPFNLAALDLGNFATALIDARTLVFASPTVLGGAHPNAVYGAYLTNALRPRARYGALLGSYSWGTKITAQLQDLLSALKLEMLGTVLAKGAPRPAEFAAIDQLADAIAARHNQ